MNELPPEKILRVVEFLLIEEAEDWIETHREPIIFSVLKDRRKRM